MALLLVSCAGVPATPALPGPAEAVARKDKAHGQKNAPAPAAGSQPAAPKVRAPRVKAVKPRTKKQQAVGQNVPQPPKATQPKATQPKAGEPKAVEPKAAKPKEAKGKAAPARSDTRSPVRPASPAAAPATTSAAAAPQGTAAPPAASTPAQTLRRARAGARRRGEAAQRRATRRRAAARSVSSAATGSARPLLRGAHAPLAVTQLTAARRGGLEEGERSATPSSNAGPPEAGSVVTRTVRDIVEVVPEALKLVLVALLALSGVLGGGYLLAAARARRLARQRAELLQEVGLLQTALLPPVPATVGAMRTSVAYRPSDGPGAGGDFYDALTLPGGRAAFILGDVSGHGRQALAQTAFIRYTLRAYLEAGLEPRLALQLASPVVGEHLGGAFATVVLAVHDPGTGSLTYACAGHPAPIVVGPTRPEPVIAASSLPIGLALRTGVRQTTVPLPPGSVVCLYTDGLAEARTHSGILGRPRLADIVEELGRDATAPALLERVAAEARLVTDDMATVVLRPTAGVTVGGFREERLEIDLDELQGGLGERFLKACGVLEPQLASAIAEARRWAASHGAAVLHVRFGTRGKTVEVLPRNVESLEAASRRRALA